MENIRIIRVEKDKTYEIQKRKQNGSWATIEVSTSYEGIKRIFTELTCPFQDNRIVNDMTFALRFKSFLKGIQVCDAASEEELDYMNHVADKLLDYQVNTVDENSDEYRYFKNNGVFK